MRLANQYRVFIAKKKCDINRQGKISNIINHRGNLYLVLFIINQWEGIIHENNTAHFKCIRKVFYNHLRETDKQLSKVSKMELFVKYFTVERFILDI